MTSSDQKSVKSLRLIQVTTKEQRPIFTSIVKSYHSYVPQPIAVGRQINYLVEWENQIIGCVGLAQAPNFPSTAIMNYFKLPHSNAYKVKWLELLPQIGNNWRFTLKPEAPENSASRILSVLVKIGPKDWKAKYGVDLKWIMTFVDETHKNITGTIYKAAGWKMIGQSAGVIMEKRGYSQFKNIKSSLGSKKTIYMWTSIVGAEKSSEKDSPQAVVVQSSTPSDQGGDGVRSDPTAPLTKRYHLEKKNGKMVIVWEKV